MLLFFVGYVLVCVAWLIKQSECAGEYGKDLFTYETKGERVMVYLTFPFSGPIIALTIIGLLLMQIPLEIFDKFAKWWEESV